jgi:hypothetical protein
MMRGDFVFVKRVIYAVKTIGAAEKVGPVVRAAVRAAAGSTLHENGKRNVT